MPPLRLILGLLLPCLGCPAAPLIIAHRGASADAPENTVAAVKRAWELGADAVEIDLHLSKDGVIIVYHDFKTERIGGRRAEVKNQTYAQLLELDVGAHKGKTYEGTRIPTLDEILAVVPAGKSIFLELKSDHALLAPLSAALSATRLEPAQLTIIGFDLEQMKAAKLLFPKLPVYWLTEISIYTPYERWEEEIKARVAAAKAAAIDGLCVRDRPSANPSFIAQAKAAGLKFFVYTIDSGTGARRFADLGVDGIITNRPDLIRASLPKKP